MAKRNESFACGQECSIVGWPARFNSFIKLMSGTDINLMMSERQIKNKECYQLFSVSI